MFRHTPLEHEQAISSDQGVMAALVAAIQSSVDPGTSPGVTDRDERVERETLRQVPASTCSASQLV
jgi:hypothetical protein